MKYKTVLLTVAFIAATVAVRASTKNTTPDSPSEIIRKTDIAGGVVHADTKKPLNNVMVTAYSATKKEKVVYTDANGNYSFSELKAGTYKLVFEKEGLRKVTREKVTIRPEEGCMLNVEMDDDDEFLIVPNSIFDFN